MPYGTQLHSDIRDTPVLFRLPGGGSFANSEATVIILKLKPPQPTMSPDSRTPPFRLHRYRDGGASCHDSGKYVVRVKNGYLGS